MALRASAELTGQEVEVQAIVDGKAAATSGVAHAEALVLFAEAVLGDDDEALDAARQRVTREVGPGGLLDAACIVGNFERMVRIADGTGIPLDTPLELLSGDVREELGLAAFGGAQNTRPAGALKQAVGRALRGIAHAALRRAGRRATAD